MTFRSATMFQAQVRQYKEETGGMESTVEEKKFQDEIQRARQQARA
jgi:hypothetical protein